MAAYVIVEVSVTDPAIYEEYRKLTPGSIAAFNGKFRARGGEVFSLEGDWNPERIVVVEFPSVEQAREWWNSESYSKARAIRQRSAETNMIIVEGV